MAGMGVRRTFSRREQWWIFQQVAKRFLSGRVAAEKIHFTNSKLRENIFLL